MDNDDVAVGELVPAMLKGTLRPDLIGVLPHEKLEPAPACLV
jgi:hypothetical protein